jgi:diguanylate cyclase (GGDEF)-like protein
MGTLCILDHKTRAFSNEDVAILKDLAGAVEEQLTHAQTAMLDDLTGLTNRRGLTVVGDYLVGLSRRTGIPLSVLLFDLDGFKAINDVHGHAMGDRALVDFSRALVSAFRESDVVCRLGGDEFCVLMAEAPASEASAPLERLDAALSQASEGRPFRIAYSVGVIPLDPQRHGTIASVLDCADKQMYREKRAKHVLAPGR